MVDLDDNTKEARSKQRINQHLCIEEGLSGIGFLPVKDKLCRQRTLKFPQARQSSPLTFAAPDFEASLIDDSDLDLIALFQAERVNHG